MWVSAEGSTRATSFPRLGAMAASVHGLANGLFRGMRSNTSGSPATPWLTDPSETGLILGHQNDWTLVIWLSLLKDLGDRGGIGFLKAS